MIEVFERQDEGMFSTKLNIVDSNNVFVGYDYEQGCCEYFGYGFVKELPIAYGYDSPDIKYFDPDLSEYVFDISFFKDDFDCLDEYEGGGMCAFKLTGDSLPYIYLILYNYHNGYYRHGFEMKKNNEELYSGSI